MLQASLELQPSLCATCQSDSFIRRGNNAAAPGSSLRRSTELLTFLLLSATSLPSNDRASCRQRLPFFFLNEFPLQLERLLLAGGVGNEATGVLERCALISWTREEEKLPMRECVLVSSSLH